MVQESKWRIFVVRCGFAYGRQGVEPIMLVNSHPGKAHLVRVDNRILKGCYLEAEKSLKYLAYYNSPNKNIEPQSRVVPLIHREYQPGELLNPLMTELPGNEVADKQF